MTDASVAAATLELPIFPLHTVLFPGGALPLRVFEQRYIEMTKRCLKEDLPFGVCLIAEGSEVGTPAVPVRVGCTATIEHWDMPQLGMFELRARGGERFSIIEQATSDAGLITARVQPWPSESAVDAPDPLCRKVLEDIVNRHGELFSAPVRLDDAAWVSFRLTELMPLDNADRQALLELTDTAARLAQLRAMLEQALRGA